MPIGIRLTLSEWELVQSVLRHDWDCVTDMLIEDMRGESKLPEDFKDFLVYRACHLDKILDKFEEQLN